MYGNLYMARFYCISNTFDPFAVSIMNDGEIVGHMPRRISVTVLAASPVNSVNVSLYSYI